MLQSVELAVAVKICLNSGVKKRIISFFIFPAHSKLKINKGLNLSRPDLNYNPDN